jgi:bisphosphoglycerate-independent phosphoglycerate mutase (AlkP superfamily)
VSISDFYYSADRRWDNNFDRAQAAYDAQLPPEAEKDFEDEVEGTEDE